MPVGLLSASALLERDEFTSEMASGRQQELRVSRTAWIVQPSMKSSATLDVARLPCTGEWPCWQAGKSCSPSVSLEFVFLSHPSVGWMWIKLTFNI